MKSKFISKTIKQKYNKIYGRFLFKEVYFDIHKYSSLLKNRTLCEYV